MYSRVHPAQLNAARSVGNCTTESIIEYINVQGKRNNYMVRIGEAPYLECSSRGDKRFSAFYANPSILRGKSIEQAYQSAKVFQDGTTGLNWRLAKGKHPINLDQVQSMYFIWWHLWVLEENLMSVLKSASGLSDMFGQTGHTCQALTLWEIRNLC